MREGRDAGDMSDMSGEAWSGAGPGRVARSVMAARLSALLTSLGDRPAHGPYGCSPHGSWLTWQTAPAAGSFSEIR